MHGIYFDDFHSFDDWGLTLIDFKMSAPLPKTKYIPLPIGNGSIDLTEAIFGDVSYNNRTATFSFATQADESSWIGIQNRIMSAIHGKRMRIDLPDDSDHYYTGRVSASPFSKYGTIANMEITAVCEPYKLNKRITTYSGTIPVGGTVTIDAINGRMRLIPEITVSAGAAIVFNGTTTNVTAGAWKLTSVVFASGTNTVTINAAQGTTYSIAYREGAL